jgi:hypothetical protein
VSPGAEAAILYARCRLALHGFQLESEAAENPEEHVDRFGGISLRFQTCFLVTASWLVAYGSDSRTFTALLVIDVRDLVKLLRHCLARAAATRGN